MSIIEEAPDKVQIGLTPAGTKNLDDLMATRSFAERQDAYRVAIGVALARGITATPEEMVGTKTSYNFIGGVDRDGSLRTLISIFAPSESRRPAAFSERLAHAGLAFLAERLVGGRCTLSEVLGPQAESDETVRPSS